MDIRTEVTKLTVPFRNFANTSRSAKFVTLCADISICMKMKNGVVKGRLSCESRCVLRCTPNQKQHFMAEHSLISQYCVSITAFRFRTKQWVLERTGTKHICQSLHVFCFSSPLPTYTAPQLSESGQLFEAGGGIKGCSFVKCEKFHDLLISLRTAVLFYSAASALQ